MLTYCMKCKMDTENVNSKAENTKMVEQCYYQNVLHVVIKNQNL